MDALELYTRMFNHECPAWTKNREYNLMFLLQQQNYFNELLKVRGKVYLSDVYEQLGFPMDQVSRSVGWRYYEGNVLGDNYIDFGMFEREIGGDYDILLNFNVDGII